MQSVSYAERLQPQCLLSLVLYCVGGESVRNLLGNVGSAVKLQHVSYEKQQVL
jgi:hypothetical protein